MTAARGVLGPGATIGVLGGGQLGRMMAVVARQMGYRIIVLDPSPRCPTAQVSDGVVVGALDDVEAAKRVSAWLMERSNSLLAPTIAHGVSDFTEVGLVMLLTATLG